MGVPHPLILVSRELRHRGRRDWTASPAKNWLSSRVKDLPNFLWCRRPACLKMQAGRLHHKEQIGQLIVTRRLERTNRRSWASAGLGSDSSWCRASYSSIRTDGQTSSIPALGTNNPDQVGAAEPQAVSLTDFVQISQVLTGHVLHCSLAGKRGQAPFVRSPAHRPKVGRAVPANGRVLFSQMEYGTWVEASGCANRIPNPHPFARVCAPVRNFALPLTKFSQSA